MACTYRMKDAAGAWQTITGKPAMMAALADGRLDHLLPAGAMEAMTTPTAAPKPAPAPRPTPAPAPNTIFTEDAATKARELLRRKLGQMNSGLDPEMLQAGITLAGYHIEKGARSFSAYAQAMLADLGDAVRPYLKSWYMGVKYDPRAAGFEGMDTAATVEAADENQISKEPENAPSADSRVERDSEVAAPERAVGDAVQDGAGRDAGGNREVGERARREGRGGQPDGAGVPADGAATGRERGDQRLPGGNAAVVIADVSAGADFRERGGGIGVDGVSTDPIPASQVAQSAGAGTAIVPRLAQQRAANALKVVPRDLENIKATLPYLLPGQQEDVMKAETRFAKPDGYGMLFTNGTGTGKTFSGLGVVKRFERQGKTNTLVMVPDDKIAADWIESGAALGLTITKLQGAKTAGGGIVVATYANVGQNDALASREWDLFVADEAHSLMQDKDGTPTSYLRTLRALSLHPDGTYQRYAMLNRGDIDALSETASQIEFNNKQASAEDTTGERREALIAENVKLEVKRKALTSALDKAKKAVQEDVADRQGEARPRLVALSATPFAYEKNIDWANGYLFDYNEGRGDESREGRGYNAGSNREQFFMQHFGYSMRYNKLTEPDGSKVDRGLMQRQFNAMLKKAGSLSGRMLDVAADYDRRFVLVDSAIGNQIDEALNWLSNQAREAPKDDRGFAALRDAIDGKFDYLSRRYLLEAIKATEVVPIVRQHMALGRKVVVFHDYKKGGGFNPFKVDAATENPGAEPDALAIQQQFNAALRQFNAKFPALVNAPLGGMPSPIEVFKREFPDVLLINGDEKKPDLLRRYKLFQDDASGPAVMLVQSAKNKGWSGHDTTGKHQRVLINLGQPTAPTLAIQQEGRIYRTGQVSNAIMRYLNTGTNWEKWAFATTIAGRASTAENLGMGELSRALKDSFISAFEESDAYPPGHEGEGVGGKERDQSQNTALTAYDRAKTFYWATQKKNSKTKAQEGVDYFATPEPLGLKMVEWLGLRGGEDAMEPSGGHGAIARWIPETTNRTVIEPSQALRARLAMVMNPAEDRIIDGTFEDLAVVNKFDGIAMNPPFGVGGKTAIEHIAKAATHLRDGGRIVALIPTGPAADKRFEAWMYGEETREVKPVARDFSTAYPEIYQGDTVTYTDVLGNTKTGKVTSRTGERLYVRSDGDKMSSSVTQFQIKAIAPTGPRAETYRPAAGIYQVAEIRLPQITFERAGTAVATRVVVIDKRRDPARAPNPRSPIDLTGISDIRELFNRLEDMSLPARAMTAEQDASEKAGQDAQPKLADLATVAADQAPAAGQGAPQGPAIERKGRKIVEHVTKTGKKLRGVVATDLTKVQAQEIDPYTFKKDGGWFIRERHVKDDAANPDIRFSASPAEPTPAGITYDTLPAAFAKQFPKLAGAVTSMLHRGTLGQKGGLVVIDSNSETQIARVFAERTGQSYDETVKMFESVNGDEIHAFYDPDSGITFVVGPNLDEASLPSVILHEAIHGQQRKSIDAKAMAMIQGRAKEAPALRAFLDRVAERMDLVGEADSDFEAASYIVEMAVMEGKQAGFSAADGPILAWIERNIGRKVADLVRDFVSTLRAWALAHGVTLKSVAVDDLVAYAMAGVKKAARGNVVTVGDGMGGVRSANDSSRVASKQAPATASGANQGGAAPRYTARDWREWSELPQFQSDDTSSVLFNHGHGGYIKQVEARTSGVFDGLFALNAPGMTERGPDVTAFRIPDDKMLHQRDLDYELDSETVSAALVDVFPRKIEAGSERFDSAWSAIVEDKSDHESLGVEDDGSIREDSFMDILGYAAEDAGESSWMAQKLRGRLAEKLGYQAVEMDDENGTSWYVVPGVESIPLPNEQGAPTNPDIRFSRSATLRAATQAATSALNKFSPSGQAALGALSADQQAAVERVFGKPKTLAERAEAFAKDWKKNLVQGVFDQFAPIKEITSKGYMLARLAKGGDSTLEALMMYGKVSVDGDGVYQVDYDGQNLKGFASTMAKLDGEHDRFLAWVSGQRAERLSEVGLENLMTQQDIAALKTLADGSTASGKARRVLYAEALRELNAFNDSVLKIAANSGLIDEATRAMYRDTPYVPFYRLSEEEVVQGPSVSKGLVNQSAWKQLKGGTDKLNEDLMGNLLKNWSHLITASANNRAAKEVLDTAARMGGATDMTNDVVAQDINGQPIYRSNTKGLVRYRGEIKRKIPAGQPYVENGQTLISDGTAEISYVGDRYFRVDDPHLMDAIASIGFTTKVWKPMADFKRYLTFGVTVNPTFKIRNLIRDSIQAVGTADLSYNPVKNILMGAKGTELMSNLRAQMLASGGMLRFGSSEGAYSGHVRRLIEKGVDPQYILDNDSKVKAFWKHKVLPAFEAYQELGDRSENVNRAALYEQLLAKGMSHAEASFWARDMMDFSMHGKWAAIRTLTAVVPFMNARLQGIYKLGRATKADYRRMGATLAAVSLASMALMLAYGDDDDWKKREDWDRDNSWWFKIGDTAFRIPKPFEVGAVGTIAERSLELMISDEMTGKRFGQRMRDLLMHNLSMNPTPQLVKPMIDLYANKDGFSGRDIETQGMEKMRPEDRYTARTSEVARFLGQLGLPNPAQLLMGRVEGLSPVQIDHLIRGYFSWVGTSATNVLDRGIRPMMDRGEQPDMRLRDVFLAGNFVESLPSGSSRYVTQFYEQAKEIEQMYASYRQTLKEGDTEKAQEIRDENPEGFAVRRSIEAAKRAESLISGQMRTIERDRAMPGEEKRARMDQLEKRRDEIARRALLVPAAAGRD